MTKERSPKVRTRRQLTPRSNLDNLKKEAKRWLKALRENDEQARARLSRAYPNAPAEPKLREVQHALALEHSVTSVALLIERGAEIEPVESNWNNTPLDTARERRPKLLAFRKMSLSLRATRFHGDILWMMELIYSAAARWSLTELTRRSGTKKE